MKSINKVLLLAVSFNFSTCYAAMEQSAQRPLPNKQDISRQSEASMEKGVMRRHSTTVVKTPRSTTVRRSTTTVRRPATSTVRRPATATTTVRRTTINYGGRQWRLWTAGAGIALYNGMRCYVQSAGYGAIKTKTCCVAGTCYTNFYL